MPLSDKATKTTTLSQEGVGEVTLTELQRKVSAEANGLQVPKGGRISKVAGQNIVTVEIDKAQYVQSFQASKITSRTGVHYSDVKKGIADPTVRRNSRFSISELARGALSVEAEEEKRINDEVERRVEEKLATLREEAIREARDKGFASGKAEAKSQIIESAKPVTDRFEGVLKEIENIRFDLFKANEEMLIHMVYQLAKTVVLKEIAEDRDYTKRLLVHLLERIGARENIKIYVGQEAYSAAETLKEGLAQTLGGLKNISIEPDPAIEDKGVRLETEFGEIDAKIEVQLQNMARDLGVAKTG